METRKKEMSGFDLLMLKKELASLSGGRIQKVFQKEKQLRFELFVSGRGTLELFFDPRKLFLTNYKREASNQRFSQYLRKHLGGQRIASIKQIGFERIIEVETESNVLMLELFSRGNAILCGKTGTILMPLEAQEWKSRKIAPNVQYKYPPQAKNPFEMGLPEFEAAVGQSEKGIAAFIAAELGLSGKYAEEACARGGVDKKRACKDIGNPEAKKLFDAAQSMQTELKPNIILMNSKPIDFAPIEMQIYGDKEKKYFPSFMEALDEFFSQAESLETGAASEAESRRLRIIESQKSAVEKWAEAEEENMIRGELIRNNNEAVQKIIDSIREMKNMKKGLEEIKAILEKTAFEGLKVREIREKEGVAVLDIPAD